MGRYHFPEAVFISCGTGKPNIASQLDHMYASPGSSARAGQLPHTCVRGRAALQTKTVTGINLSLASWAFSVRLLHQFCTNETHNQAYFQKGSAELYPGHVAGETFNQGGKKVLRTL